MSPNGALKHYFANYQQVTFGDIFTGTREACIEEAKRRNEGKGADCCEPKWVVEPLPQENTHIVVRYMGDTVPARREPARRDGLTGS